MSEFTFQSADKILWHDKLLAATILKLIPRYIHPNHFTLFRLLASPVVATLMYWESYRWGLVVFLLMASTDAIDGSLARTRNQITEWGKIYDPLADKILIGCMIFIIVLRYIDPWTAFFIMAIELIIIITAWIRKRKGKIVQANVWGKIKMILQVIGVSILLLAIVFDWGALTPFASGTLYLAIVFAIISLLTYSI